ncbi:hypothetical protein HA44_22250 [Mixta gaviniae]|nr:hypothetical protein HA44_22250 [Mixta gaviniae]
MRILKGSFFIIFSIVKHGHIIRRLILLSMAGAILQIMPISAAGQAGLPRRGDSRRDAGKEQQGWRPETAENARAGIGAGRRSTQA